MDRKYKFVLWSLVIAGMVGGTVAWASASTEVDLRIDGQSKHIRTSASDVRHVLSQAGIEVTDHDLVAPDLDSRVSDGAQIVVRRGHRLQLSIDGKLREIWVNADSVGEAMDQLGYDGGEAVSVSRSRRLDSSVTSLSINTPKHITFKIDGKTIETVTAGPTVADAARDAGILLSNLDKVSAGRESLIKASQVIRVQRGSAKSIVEIVAARFRTVKQVDPNAWEGTEILVRGGKAGKSRVTYRITYLDRKRIAKVVVKSDSLVKPVDAIVRVGIKSAPFITNTPAGSPQRIAASMVAERGWDGGQFDCLVSLWDKESGWRVDAYNPSGAYGIPQSLPGEKMATMGSDWQTNPATQIAWGLSYIAGTYGSPCSAWEHSQATNWY